MNKEPITSISNLKNVKEIKISKNDSTRKEVNITNPEDISFFLETFIPSESKQNQSTQLKESNFEEDGQIEIIFSSEQKPLIIEFDIDEGYKVAINSKEYYERFTYRTGRYLVEKLNQPQS